MIKNIKNFMKNVITKFAAYKEYGLFNHIYLLDVDYVFNEKSVEDIMEFIKNEPFFDVMIHTNDISHEVIRLFKEISKYKNIWLQSNESNYEEFGNMNEDIIKIIGFDKVNVMIDALGDEIDVKKSLKENNLVSFIYEKLPF